MGISHPHKEAAHRGRGHVRVASASVSEGSEQNVLLLLVHAGPQNGSEQRVTVTSHFSAGQKIQKESRDVSKGTIARGSSIGPGCSLNHTT